MNVFNCPSFKIESARELVEASTYAFVLEGPEEFKPSVVIKWQNVRGAKAMPYAEQQMGKLRAQLKSFMVVEPLKALDAQRARLVYEWGEGRRTFRQSQTYWAHEDRVYTLTATAMNITFEKYRRELESIVDSFVPKTLARKEEAARG